MSVTKVSSAMQDLTDDYAFSGTVSGAGAPSHRNDIINGGLVVNQENQTAPADDAYTIGDLFLHVGEGTPVMSLETDGPQGTRYWQKMVLDANAQGGLVYFMSNADCQDYIANGKLSFGIQLKTTAATISNARIGILKWTGTADAVTSDVVGTWASDGTNPTLATSWSYENTPANIGLTTSFARHTVENVTVDSDTKNIAIFVWTDDGTITASDVIGFSEWQCNPGSTVNAFSSPPIATVFDQVKYFVEKHGGNLSGGGERLCTGHAISTTIADFPLYYVRKRVAPTTTYGGSVSDYDANDNAGRTVSGIAIQASSTSVTSSFIRVTTGGTLTVNGALNLGTSNANQFLFFDARH
jgi:hypothetical protein